MHVVSIVHLLQISLLLKPSFFSLSHTHSSTSLGCLHHRLLLVACMCLSSSLPSWREDRYSAFLSLPLSLTHTGIRCRKSRWTRSAQNRNQKEWEDRTFAKDTQAIRREWLKYENRRWDRLSLHPLSRIDVRKREEWKRRERNTQRGQSTSHTHCTFVEHFMWTFGKWLFSPFLCLRSHHTHTHIVFMKPRNNFIYSFIYLFFIFHSPLLLSCLC